MKIERFPALRTILASSSPRRKELLSQLGLSFEVCNPEIEEKILAGEDPRSYVERNAKEKAAAVMQKYDDNVLVIAADTIVVLKQRVLEKPQDHQDAKRMLQGLSGNEHTVITGFCVSSKAKSHIESVLTKVTFKKLSEIEINSYIATGEPLDKAGAYAAQGIGSYFVKSIVGSYTNVVGLPMAELADVLTSWRVP